MLFTKVGYKKTPKYNKMRATNNVYCTVWREVLHKGLMVFPKVAIVRI